MKTTILLSLSIFISLIGLAQKQGELIISSNNNFKEIKNCKNTSFSKSITKVFNYDNNEIKKGLGVRKEAYTLGTFIELKDTLLKTSRNQYIDYIRFGIDDTTIIKNATIAIYEDSLTNSPINFQSISVDKIQRGWNQIPLENKYLILNKTIFVGVLIETSAGGFTQTYDTDPVSYPSLSGHTILNGEYFGTLSNEIGIDADYNIQAIITDGQGANYSDLAIVAVKPSNSTCSFSNEEILKVTIVNKGEDSIYTNFDLEVTINDKLITQQVTPTTFYPNVEKVVNMPTFDMSSPGIYYTNASININDINAENNTLSKILSSGNAIIRVEMYTDKRPEENSWTLVDAEENTISTNGIMEEETFYSTEICIIDSLCYTWFLNDKNNDGITVSDTLPYAFALFYNDSLVYKSNTSAEFNNEFTQYGIGTGCFANDMSVVQIMLPEFEAPGIMPVKGIISNEGIDTLKTFTLQYVINDSVSSIDTIKNIALSTNNQLEFSHSLHFNFTENLVYNVEVIADQPNFKVDEEPANNKFNKKLLIHENVVTKKQLIEHFTSSTNEECFNYTPLIDEVLANRPGEYSLIRYPINWPGDGDPYYTEQARVRADYYNLRSLPSIYRNGWYDNDFSIENFDINANYKTIIELSADAKYIDNTVNISTSIEAIATTDTNLALFIAIIENNTSGNIGTNGENEFYNVFMQMLPDAKGYKLPVIPENSTIEYSASFNMETTFMEEMDDLSTVVFVQNTLTNQSLQSITIPVELFVDINTPTTDVYKVYPNPFNSSIYIDNARTNTKAEIINTQGQIVKSITFSTSTTINTHILIPGMYYLKITNSEYGPSVIKKIIKM